MFVLAVGKLDGDADARARAYARATGAGAYDARVRVQAPAPRVVSTHASAEDAARLADALEPEGFAPFVFDASTTEHDGDRLIARSFQLGDDEVHVELRDGRRHTLALRQVRLILRGTRIQVTTEVETRKERKLSIGKAVLTGGLAMTKTVEKTVEQQRDARDGFLYCHEEGGPTVAFLETGVLYDGLGAAREPTRAGNFARLARLLRDRSPSAVWDERLLTRAGQVQVLGGLLPPEQALDLAAALLAHALVRDSAPYR
jgi:hypothetical protein